jgi:hypothetical protein
VDGSSRGNPEPNRASVILSRLGRAAVRGRSQDKLPIEIGWALRAANRRLFWMRAQCVLFQVDTWVANFTGPRLSIHFESKTCAAA